ncbi:BadF/BadG/BcrA/BcrD ATPase family protein [Sulfitobacter sp. SK011]|uniref:BadF/BadG/BcrA/BcrD ATPase family protein n=1 Tax=Sulfitobacter sp. SK011 TaxID=1389004 RepID=UPI000E0A5A5E|nr:BadF/BadG/BcrA/BcrD ATPase family protein [Sulfitobacter sp. SK011]AXI41461.1 ATPase [Sulfitobacter sp. SK011]
MTEIDQTVLIAVDGGGTGCRAAVGTVQAGIIAETRGGPSNVSTNFEGSVANITETIAQALHTAELDGIDLSQTVAHIGVAGANTEGEMRQVEAALPYGRCRVTGDRATTVAGVLGADDGYVLALGTGTIIARQHAQEMTTVGGWGFQLSDQASGAWLGRTLLTRILLAEDRLIDHSPLSSEVCARYGGGNELVVFSNTAKPSDYAKFAPEIIGAADNGDKIALSILNEGAQYVECGLNALGFRPGDGLCLSGGVGPRYAPYLSAPYIQNLREPQGNALQGAFSLARRVAVAAS